MNLGGVETLHQHHHASGASSLSPGKSAEDEVEELFLPAPLSWFPHPEVTRQGEEDSDDGQNTAASIEYDSADEAEKTITIQVVQQTPVPADTKTTTTSLIIASSEVEIDHSYHHHNHHPTGAPLSVGAARPFPAPSWRELSSQVLPAAARELLSASLDRIYHTARLSYASSCWRYRKYSDLNQTTSALGYHRVDLPLLKLPELPPFSSLPWLDRQLVLEWKTYRLQDQDGDVEDDFKLSRTLVPALVPRPEWEKSDQCSACQRLFGPTRLRHHCRHCGKSLCQAHSAWEHPLPHLGYQVPERVCEPCKLRLEDQCLAERVAWRLARCRDFDRHDLAPYFEIGVETLEEAALRVTQAALTMARSIPLGAQATVAVETVDVLRKYGLNGIYTVMLRQEFLAAADLLQKALGINRSVWPLSVHELSAAIFYALAQHRALRGLNPEREHMIHARRDQVDTESGVLGLDEPDETRPVEADLNIFQPVCDAVSDDTLSSLIVYAPIALNFIYVEKPVDMQLLAAQQGWRLLYAYLEQEANSTDRPASALFVNEEQKIACVAVRGTSTIHDVVTDIRQVPVPFPDTEPTKADEGWTTVFRGKGVAACGMAGAALTLYREHIDSLLFLAKRGYKVRLTGHSLGGAVATLLGMLVYRDLERECSNLFPETSDEVVSVLRVYSFGTPSCVDEQLAEDVSSFVTTVVLHDDCVPRLTPSSCRGLLKHLLHIRETWVKDHFSDDIKAITDRARTAWAPRWRGSFTLSKSSSKFKTYCRKQLQYGKQQITLVKEKLVGDECGDSIPCGGRRPLDTIDERTEEFVVNDVNDLPDVESSENRADKDEMQVAVEPRMLVDYMGGDLERGTEGLVIDGDEFFDTSESLLEGADDESESEDDAESSPFQSTVTAGSSQIDNEETELMTPSDEDSAGPVVVEETPLPKMYVPGRVVHIYSHRGVYRASYVPRNFRDLRRISMAGNMLSDHKVRWIAKSRAVSPRSTSLIHPSRRPNPTSKHCWKSILSGQPRSTLRSGRHLMKTTLGTLLRSILE